jgi:hypothetical protein
LQLLHGLVLWIYSLFFRIFRWAGGFFFNKTGAVGLYKRGDELYIDASNKSVVYGVIFSHNFVKVITIILCLFFTGCSTYNSYIQPDTPYKVRQVQIAGQKLSCLNNYCCYPWREHYVGKPYTCVAPEVDPTKSGLPLNNITIFFNVKTP